MTYQVIARKYRPQTFDEVIGQAHVTQTLKNAIAQNRVAHAYVFSGVRGVGKTTTARILAKALDCEKGPTVLPCGTCPPCREIAAGTAIDVLEIDAASNRGIDEIRELRENVRYLPARDRCKVFIIDEAHMLTTEAFNALLKTLEEPPPRVLFILATTEPQRIPRTILSRCQSFHFRTIGFDEIFSELERIGREEKIRAEPAALAVMARAAEGSLRDSLSFLDQAIAYCGEEITDAGVRELLGVVAQEVLDELMAAVAEGSSERVVALVERLVSEGQNLHHFVREAIRHLRNLLMARIAGPSSSLIEAPPDERARIVEVAGQFGEEDLLRFFQILVRTDSELRWSPHPRLHLELGLLRIVEAERLVPLEELLAELEGGEKEPRATPSRGGSGGGRRVPGRDAAPTTPSADNQRATESAADRATETSVPSLAPPPAETSAAVNASYQMGAAAAAVALAEGQLPGVRVEEIKTAVYKESKFLGSFIEHVLRWELENGEVRLLFAQEHRTLTEMLPQKELDRLTRLTQEVLGRPVRVCVKLETQPGRGTRTPGAGAVTPERSQPERADENVYARASNNPRVRAFVEQFGGQIREVRDLRRTSADNDEPF